jgi:hypothetical protein
MRLFEVRLIASVGLVLWLALGCEVGPDGSFTDLQPLVYPSEGRLGDGGAGATAAIVIDSNYLDMADDWEFHDLHKARVKVLVSDPSPTPAWTDVPAQVRQVFSLQTPPNSNLSKLRPGATVTLVVFDLPDQAALNSPAPPLTVVLKVLIDDVLTYEPRFIVSGVGGTPTAFIDPSIFSGNINTQLQPQPMIRLRGKRLAGYFEPGMPRIGALDFFLIYDPACITGVRAYGATEAANATTIVGPALPFFGGTKYRRIALVDPDGFDLDFLTDAGADQSLAGNGPLIDLGFDLKAGSGCTVSQANAYAVFTMRVADLDGNWIFEFLDVPEVDRADAPSPTALLRAYEVDLPAPPGGGGGC